MSDEEPKTPDDSDGVEPTTPESEPATRVDHRLGARLKRYFLTGLVVGIPISVTVYLAWAFVTFIDNNVLPLIPDQYNPDTLLPYNIPGLGVLILMFGITLLGFLAANLFGNALITMGERIVGRMPVVRTIYTAIKQIMQTVVAQGDDTFQEVCLFEYPRKGIYAIGFVTSRTGGEIRRAIDRDMISVFLPTTPNPTSGFLLFIPKTEAHILDMSVEEGAKLVISAGLVMPEDVPDPAKAGVSDSRARRFLKRAEKAVGGR
jgi:uncharacterized membrane protein